MITEQNGQIIVDELRNMDDMPKDSIFILVDTKFKTGAAFINPENKIHVVMYLDKGFRENDYLGWLPMPKYKPKKADK